jgi:hypothetical protein
MPDSAHTAQPPDLWGEILSRDPAKIKSIFSLLPPEERTAVIAHLSKMLNEEGYHPEQVISAQSALNVIKTEELKPMG